MNDGDYQIDILDALGQIAGQKLRKDVVKGVDIYHAVYGVIVTPDNDLVISVIGNPKGLSNLHAGKLGCTCATIRRTEETGLEAMKRAITKELKIEASPTLISEEFIDIDNTKRLISFYKISAEMPTDYNKEDISELKLFSVEDFENLLKTEPERLTPPLKQFWSKYLKSY